MAVQEALVVPVAVEALVVNDAVRREQPFLRWGVNYEQLRLYAAPEPPPFEAPTDFGGDEKHNGVYLSWELPDALRRADTGPGGGDAEFPLVPNRWLVVRGSGPKGQRQATGWVVESDFLHPEEATSPFFTTVAGAPQPIRIGRKLEIGGAGWSEPAQASPPFLTAVAPGLPGFAAYQPYNEDVFSIHDPLTGVAAADTLSYLVVGWYSDPSRDPLAQGDFGERLAELGWTVAGADSASRSVYSGFVHGIGWSASGAAPSGAMPPAEDVSIALGPTAIDALTALVAEQSGGSVDAERLEAFQHGVIDSLDEPDGPAELAHRAHDAAFSLLPGGFAWEIVDVPGASGAPPEAAELEAEDGWLATLNTEQTAYDEALRTLSDLQRRLYETWWLVGRAGQLRKPPTGVDVEDLEKQLDPTHAGGLAQTTAAQAAKVEGLGRSLPSGATEQQLREAIEARTKAHSLPESRQLKRVGGQPFARPNDPVLLLSGTGSESLLGSEQQIPCRFPDQLVTGLRFEAGIEAARLGPAIPTPNLANVPAVAAGLAAELFLLDPINAETMARVGLGREDAATVEKLEAALAAPGPIAIGTPPALGARSWAQPWSPLYLLWELDYYPIDFAGSSGPAPWSFDGSDYSWPGSPGYDEEPLGFAGRTLLTPQAAFNLRAQIARYEEHHPDAELEAVAAFVAAKDRWDLLSQTLDGLGAMLALRDPRTRPTPVEPLAALIEEGELGAPAPGVAQAQFGEWGPSPFQQLRAGQVAFSRVAVVDRFGQALYVVDKAHSLNLAPTLAPQLKPEQPVLSQSPKRFVQLPPRLPQAARLRLDLVSAKDDAELSEQSVGANPICGWLLPNHLDRSLLAFDPGGAPLGELRVVSAAGGQQQPSQLQPNWSASPGSPYAEVPEMAKELPHLTSLLEYFMAQPDAARATDLGALRSAVDETLASIEPLGGATDGSLALLAGRPLCLVRAAVRLELDGAPIADPSWRYAMEPEPPMPAFAGYRFPIRLGEEGRLGDGLVGYYLGGEYGRFNVIRPGAESSAYVAAIGPGNYLELAADAAQPTYLTLLLDPLAPVHAISDVLPVATLRLPPALLRGPLAALAPTFRAGPLLTTARQVAAGGTAIVMPRPVLRRGTWTWAETQAGAWTYSPVENADGTARLPEVPVARNGMLKLSGAEEGTPPSGPAGAA